MSLENIVILTFTIIGTVFIIASPSYGLITITSSKAVDKVFLTIGSICLGIAAAIYFL
jgi:uncharacterized membrane protein